MPALPLTEIVCNTEHICNTKHVCNTEVYIDGKRIPLEELEPIELLPSTPYNPDNSRKFIRDMQQELTATLIIPKELLR